MSNQEEKWTVDQIIEYFLEPNSAIEFFYERRIANIKSIEFCASYEVDKDRKEIVLKVREKGKDDLNSIMIDIRKGQPSIDQVYDAIYGIGKDCSKRVIMYTEETLDQEDWNPTIDEIAVRSLIEAMNANPLKLYLEKFHDESLRPELWKIDKFEENRSEFSIADLPSPERFRAEEFWSVYFDWHNETWYEAWKAFSGGTRETGDWGHMLFTEPEVIEIPVYWTENRIKYVVKQTDEEGDYLRKIWTLMQDELKKMYHGRVEFEYLPGRLPKIVIQFSDRPVSWLMTATSKERFEFARQLHMGFYGLRTYLNETMKEAEELNVA
jgi:hypothetical protein